MSAPLGGSMTVNLAAASDLVDGWVKHCQDTGASTPELLTTLMFQLEHPANHDNRVQLLALMVATAIQRLAAQELHADEGDDTTLAPPT